MQAVEVRCAHLEAQLHAAEEGWRSAERRCDDLAGRLRTAEAARAEAANEAATASRVVELLREEVAALRAQRALTPPLQPVAGAGPAGSTAEPLAAVVLSSPSVAAAAVDCTSQRGASPVSPTSSPAADARLAVASPVQPRGRPRGASPPRGVRTTARPMPTPTALQLGGAGVFTL